jgi:hypothetical protein
MYGRLLAVLTVTMLALSANVAAETAWTPVFPAPALPGDLTAGRLVDVAAVSPADVWAVGQGLAGGDEAPLITHWTGVDWRAAETPSVPDLHSFVAIDAVSADDVWAVGNGSVSVVMHYDGTEWSATTPSSSAFVLTDVDMTSASDGWVVGWRMGTSGPRPLVMRWRNGRWAAVSVPPVGDGIGLLRHVYARAGDDVWAVGSLGEPLIGQAPLGGPALVMHFDGARWKQVEVPHGGDPDATNDLWSVTAVSADEVWAVGDSCVWEWDRTPCQPLILRLSNGGWQVVPPAGDHGTNLRDVAARSGDDIWAVGYDLPPDGGQEADHVEHWDGQRFTTVPVDASRVVRGQPASALEAVTRFPGSDELWVVGWQDASPQVIRHS